MRAEMSQQVEKIESYLEEQLPTYLEALRKMVETNSFTFNPTGVDRLAGLTADLFRELGFTAEMIPSANPRYGHHLVLIRQGSGRKRLGFVSHLDTVFPPEEEEANDFRWREVGEKIYGPGTVDIKGGTVIMYMVLDALRYAAPLVFEETDWVLLLDASEEEDGEEFGSLCKKHLQREETLACLIFEGGGIGDGNANVVVARKGRAVFRVRAEGRAAHSGSAHRSGANAVVELAHAINRIAGFTDYDRELTFNVGAVNGGTVVNRVPHSAAALVEMRAFDDGIFEQGLERMRALPATSTVTSAEDGYRCQLQVEIVKQVPPWPQNPNTDKLYSYWKEAGKQLDISVWPEARGGLSDGNYFWELFPTIDGLGPAGGNAHCSERSGGGQKEQEYVRRDSFVPKALLNSIAILKLLSSQ